MKRFLCLKIFELKNFSQTALKIMISLIITLITSEYTTMTILYNVHKFFQYPITENNKNK